jgi:hypothetical protein
MFIAVTTSRPMPTRLVSRAVPIVVVTALLGGCDSLHEILDPPPTAPPPLATNLAFHAGALRTGHPKREHVRNLDASAAITPSRWDYFYASLAPSLDAWTADPRINVNPNVAVAIVVAESRMDSLLVSLNPDNGIAQLTETSDLFILDRAPRPTFQSDWMLTEARTWPRDPRVHSLDATHDQIVALIQGGQVTAQTEYFFRPLQALRGLLFNLRLLEETWTTNGESWGQFGTWARERINGGAPLTESQLLDLVLVSYNQGYPLVHDLVEQYGAAWTSHIGERSAEGAFYLPEVRRFVSIFQGAAEASP